MVDQELMLTCWLESFGIWTTALAVMSFSPDTPFAVEMIVMVRGADPVGIDRVNPVAAAETPMARSEATTPPRNCAPVLLVALISTGAFGEYRSPCVAKSGLLPLS